jgi:hypothetical protein
MNDDHLSHLVRALDAAVESSPAGGSGTSGISERAALCASIDHAALRLRCLTSRLGSVAEESPYLAFLRRTTRAADAQYATRAVAISA